MKVKITNFMLRIFNAVIWVPIIVCGVLLFTGGRHLFGRLLILMFTFVSGYEMGCLLKKKEPTLNVWIFVLYGGLLPALTMLFQEFPRNTAQYIFMIVFLLMSIFTWEAFTYSKLRSPCVISRISSQLFGIIYPGLLASFIIMLPMLNYPLVVFSMFFFVTMLNDTLAYFVGLLFGKKSKTQGYIPVSPKKSLVGFLGGIVASIATIVIYYYWIQPELFGERTVWYAVLMGTCCGLAAIVGDLFESLIKRSVEVKDSGNFFMGRGGVLDSFDSLVFVAPIFYYFIILI